MRQPTTFAAARLASRGH